LAKRHALIGERINIGCFNRWVTQLAERIATPLIHHNHVTLAKASATFLAIRGETRVMVNSN
jgi:hypothetical protein